MYNGRRQPSRDGTSRMTRECHVRFCEGLGVKFPGPTRQSRQVECLPAIARCPLRPKSDRPSLKCDPSQWAKNGREQLQQILAPAVAVSASF
jgi:hypothetical protein